MYDAAAAAEQQLKATSKYGSRLTCPGCGGEEFYIYRNNNIASVVDDNNEMVVECKNSQCQIVTQTFARRTGYQEDVSQAENMAKSIVNQQDMDIRLISGIILRILWNGNVLSTKIQKQYIK